MLRLGRNLERDRGSMCSPCIANSSRSGPETIPMQQQSRQHEDPDFDSPMCPTCRRTMRLVGRETGLRNGELLTFKCECGQIVTATTNQ